MKKQLSIALSFTMAISVAVTGCGKPAELSDTPSSYKNNATSDEGNENISSSEVTELIARFGDEGQPFAMHLEDNSTAAVIAGYVGTSDWQLPIYSYDESDVMQYYDIPSRYEIPDNSETVTEAHAGDVFYSDPNRIILYYHDAEINEEYTKIGTFEATDEFIRAVEENPVLEGWGNTIIVISDEE